MSELSYIPKQSKNNGPMVLQDTMSLMIGAQVELDRRIGVDHIQEAKTGKTVERLSGLVRACRHECTELEDSTQWKWWRPKTAQEFDKQNIRVEIIDLVHFSLSMALAIGCDFNELQKYALKEAALNKIQSNTILGIMICDVKNYLVKILGGNFEYAHEDLQQDLLQQIVEKVHRRLSSVTEHTRFSTNNLKHKFDREAVLSDIYRILNYVVAMGVVIGMSEEDIFKTYLMKMDVNHKRQDSGYVVKDENDCKHI